LSTTGPLLLCACEQRPQTNENSQQCKLCYRKTMGQFFIGQKKSRIFLTAPTFGMADIISLAD